MAWILNSYYLSIFAKILNVVHNKKWRLFDFSLAAFFRENSTRKVVPSVLYSSVLCQFCFYVCCIRFKLSHLHISMPYGLETETRLVCCRNGLGQSLYFLQHCYTYMCVCTSGSPINLSFPIHINYCWITTWHTISFMIWSDMIVLLSYPAGIAMLF